MAKKTGTAVIKWEEELANEAKQMSAIEKPTGGRKWISQKDGQMMFAGEEVPDNELSVVILGVYHENQWYDGAYVEGEPQTPACFAFAETEDELEPHELAQDKQSEACAGCPLNEWGSADRGEGKACKNVRRLVMISADDIDNVENAELAFMKLPVTSVKNWSSYFTTTLQKRMKRPYWAVVTKLTLEGKEYNFALDKEAGDIDPDSFPKLKERHKQQLDELGFPYEPIAKKITKPAKKSFGKRK